MAVKKKLLPESRLPRRSAGSKLRCQEGSEETGRQEKGTGA